MFILEYFFMSLAIAILIILCTFFAVGISVAGIIYIVDYTINLVKSILNKK